MFTISIANFHYFDFIQSEFENKNAIVKIIELLIQYKHANLTVIIQISKKIIEEFQTTEFYSSNFRFLQPYQMLYSTLFTLLLSSLAFKLPPLPRIPTAPPSNSNIVQLAVSTQNIIPTPVTNGLKEVKEPNKTNPKGNSTGSPPRIIMGTPPEMVAMNSQLDTKGNRNGSVAGSAFGTGNQPTKSLGNGTNTNPNQIYNANKPIVKEPCVPQVILTPGELVIRKPKYQPPSQLPVLQLVITSLPLPKLQQEDILPTPVDPNAQGPKPPRTKNLNYLNPNSPNSNNPTFKPPSQPNLNPRYPSLITNPNNEIPVTRQAMDTYLNGLQNQYQDFMNDVLKLQNTIPKYPY